MNEIGPNWRAHLAPERRFQWADYEWIWRLGLAGPSVKLALETLARAYPEDRTRNLFVQRKQ